MQRRLQTVVADKKLVPTIKAARQFIIHKKILVNGEVVNSPAYVVPVEFENNISLKQTNRKKIEVVEEKENGD